MNLHKRKLPVLIGVNTSTLSRELKRNISNRGRGALEYKAHNAQRKTSLRHQTKNKHFSFTDEMKVTARSWLEEEKYSPELIHTQDKRTIWGICEP